MKRVAALLLLFLFLPVSALADLQVHFLNVGQGDCTVVLCDGESMVIDGGPRSASGYVYSYLRKTLNLRHIDYVISTLQVICYGPHALTNARKIRSFLFVDGPGFPRAILRDAALYPVPDPLEPMLLHEPEGSLWRQRADLTVSLRAEEKETHPIRRGAITVPPGVIVYTE